MKEMNVFTLNGEQYEVADKAARESVIYKRNIGAATPEDTQEVHRKEDGTLWVKH